MNYQVQIANGMTYLECTQDDENISDETGILELVAACIENGTNLLLLDADCLSNDFFKLRTGLAGSVLQKLVNYQIRAALVASDESVNQGRFREMALEANRGNQFRIFNSKTEAEEWLTGEQI